MVAVQSIDSEIARLLNLNFNDSNNLTNIVNDFFANDWEDDTECPETGLAKEDALEDDEFDQCVDLFDSVMENAAMEEYKVFTADTEFDQVEWENASKFSCNCQYNDGQPCYRLFTPEEMIHRRAAMRELTSRDQMLILLGKISCSINNSETTNLTKRKEQTPRQRQRTYYWMEGKRLCRNTFKFLHMLSQDRLTGLLLHYKEHGLESKEKKSGGRKNNTRSLEFEDLQRAVRFLTNYASENALVLPGRVPGFKRDDMQLLPSSHTKILVYNCYRQGLENTGHRIMGDSNFFKLWKKVCPFIITAKPMTDLCWVCQENNTLIFRSANLTDVQKIDRVAQQNKHLLIVKTERSLYNNMVTEAKKVCAENDIKDLSSNQPCSRNITMHYSFDYAQQVHLPSNPLQPGPIYFLVPRKYGLFGVCCEGIPRQVNFLVDEAHLISKGSNAVISYLHFFFSNYGIGETDVHLHCDNCSGQNKNRFVLWFCAWRVAMGLHRSITLNFLIAGHTKFAPDWCFGLLKRAFKRHVVPSQSVLEKVVNDSSTVNIAQVIGREDGTTEVPVCDWQTFFAGSCKPVLGMKKYQHFRFDAEHPGMVFVKKEAGSDELPFQILLQGMDFPDGEPVILTPPGLSLQRQQYLYKNIRPFVDYPYKDTVCPRPEVLPVDDSDDKSAREMDLVVNLVLEQTKDAELGRGRGRGRGRECGQPLRYRSRSPH